MNHELSISSPEVGLNSRPRSSVWIEQRFPKPLVARSSRAGGKKDSQ
jgi:hypothetical protein